MTQYIVRASLHEEANSGWVWLAGFPSRTLVKIANGATGRCVICEVRRFDPNFLGKYNHSPRIELDPQKLAQTIVLSQWYRDALGGFSTTESDNRSGLAELTISRCRCRTWAGIRAACLHPDIVARIGTRLGVLGGWLGLVGLVPVVLQAFPVIHPEYHTTTLFSIALATGLVALCLARGPRAPAERSDE